MPPELTYTADEMMTVSAARALRDGMTCFVGIGLPSAAANLARATHAPDLVLIYESGTIGAKPAQLPLSIGDGILAETADAVVSVPEIFNYWLQPGRIDVGFLGAAQIDKFGNINTTAIGGDYRSPKVRLPGAGGAPEIAASCREVIVVVRQSRRSFVEQVDFVTSVGYGVRRRGPRAARAHRRRAAEDHHRPGRPRARPADTRAHTDRVVPGVSAAVAKERTGWDLAIAAEPLEIIAAPTAERSPRAAAAVPRRLPIKESSVTADVTTSLTVPDTGRLILPSYERPAGVHPPLDFDGYRSTALRHPKQPLVLLPHRLTEVTGPLLGDQLIADTDSDLTTQHGGEPQGQRIIVAGRVLDSDGRPVPDTLIEIWQTNAAGRYRHSREHHPAPLDPNFDGTGRCHHRLGRPVPVHHHRARRLSVGEPPQRVAPGAHSLLAVRPGVHPAPGHPDVLPRRPAAADRPDLQLGPGLERPGSG